MLTTSVVFKQWRFILADGINALILTVVSLKILYSLQVSIQVCAVLTEGNFSVIFVSLSMYHVQIFYLHGWFSLVLKRHL